MPILIALLIALTGFNVAADVRFITETENTADYEKFRNSIPNMPRRPTTMRSTTKDAAARKAIPTKNVTTACFWPIPALMTTAFTPTAARTPIAIQRPNAVPWAKASANIPAAVFINASKKPPIPPIYKSAKTLPQQSIQSVL